MVLRQTRVSLCPNQRQHEPLSLLCRRVREQLKSEADLISKHAASHTGVSGPLWQKLKLKYHVYSWYCLFCFVCLIASHPPTFFLRSGLCLMYNKQFEFDLSLHLCLSLSLCFCLCLSVSQHSKNTRRPTWPQNRHYHNAKAGRRSAAVYVSGSFAWHR